MKGQVPRPRRDVATNCGAAGDRRDQDIIEQGEIVGRFFDHVLLYQDAAQRGRADGEVLALLGPTPLDGPVRHVRLAYYQYRFTTGAERASRRNCPRLSGVVISAASANAAAAASSQT